MKCWKAGIAYGRSIRMAIMFSMLFAGIAAQAQLHHDRGHGQAALIEAGEHYRNDEKEKALEVLGTVNRNDSLYERVLMSRIEILVEQEKYPAARELCDAGIRHGGMRSGSFHVMRTAILVDEKLFDQAIASADSTIGILPGLFRPRHLKVLALAGADRKKEALELAMENARRFPYRRDAHVLLGTIAFNEGRLAEAALALSLAQIVRFDDDFADKLLGYYDSMLSNKVEAEPEGYDLSLTKDDLSEASLLLKNQVAMNKKYKVKPDLEYPMCRQAHLLFASLENVPEQGGFYNEFYGGFAREIMRNDLFEGFVYHCLSSSRNPSISKLAKKNSSKVTAFRQRMSELLDRNYAVYAHEDGGPELIHFFNNDGDLFSFGPGDLEKEDLHGTWTYFHANGRKSAQGELNTNGKKQGVWINWYENGVESSRASFTDGEMDGEFLVFNILGNMRDSSTVRGGEQQGLVCSYYPLGGRRACKTAVDDIWNGPAFDLFQSGGTEFKYTLKEGKAEGPVEQFWADGSVRYTGAYVSDQRDGMHVNKFPNGNTENEYTYVAGKTEGPYKEWYYHGQLSGEGIMKAGKPSGEIKRYDEFGTLTSSSHFDDQGRLQGITTEFDDHGRPYMELEYNKDLLIRYRYLDPAGKVLSEGSRSKGKFDLRGFHSEGGKKVEGTYLDEGAKVGEWKYYYADGTLQSVEQFEKGEVVGTQSFFDQAGKLTGKNEIYEQNGKKYKAFERYHPSGTLKDRGQWLNDVLEGELKRFHPDGSIESIEYYEDGDRHGWQEEYDAAGKLEYAERRVYGALAERVNYDEEGNEYERIKVGPGAFELVLHHPQGTVSARMKLMNGMLHGKALWTYPDGSKEVEAEFLNGQRHGEWTYYHPNGQKSLSVTYHLGNRTGTEKGWYHDGEQSSEITYVDGYIHGTDRRYHINGKPASEEEYHHGVLHGRFTTYAYDGTPQLVRYYHKGRLVAYASPNADGSVRDSTAVTAAVHTIESRYPDGKTARVMNYRNGRLHGEFKEFHPNGQLMEEAEFNAGEWVSSKEFLPNGKVHRSSSRLEGELHGERVIYWENGQVRQKQNYLNGELHGIRTFHDKSGKVIATYKMRSGDVVEIL